MAAQHGGSSRYGSRAGPRTWHVNAEMVAVGVVAGRGGGRCI